MLQALLVVATFGACREPAHQVVVAAEELGPIAASVNAFAADSFGPLAQAPGNLCYSPTSMHAALVLTYAGARGTSADALRGALHLPQGEGWTDARRHAAFGSMIAELGRERDDAVARIANALWVQQGYALEPETVELLREQHGAGPRRVDFRSGRAAGLINGWIEEQTERRIRNMIPEGLFGPDTRLVLTNALYFRARWESRFKERATRDRPFYLSYGSSPEDSVEVPMMHQTLHARLFESERLQAVTLPFRGGSSMVVVLPRERDGLANLERELGRGLLDDLLEGGAAARVALSLPRFRFEWRSSLNAALDKLGLGELFGEGADLSGFTGSSGERLRIDEVLHQAFIAVDEEGTEAAAATVVSVVATGISVEEPVVFEADHPFLFLIVGPDRKQILFLGRVVDPRG